MDSRSGERQQHRQPHGRPAWVLSAQSSMERMVLASVYPNNRNRQSNKPHFGRQPLMLRPRHADTCHIGTFSDIYMVDRPPYGRHPQQRHPQRPAYFRTPRRPMAIHSGRRPIGLLQRRQHSGAFPQHCRFLGNNQSPMSRRLFGQRLHHPFCKLRGSTTIQLDPLGCRMEQRQLLRTVLCRRLHRHYARRQWMQGDNTIHHHRPPAAHRRCRRSAHTLSRHL